MNVPATRSAPAMLAAFSLSESGRRPIHRLQSWEDRDPFATFRAQYRNYGCLRKNEAGLTQAGEMLRAGLRASQEGSLPKGLDSNALELFFPKTWVKKLTRHSQRTHSSVQSSREVCTPVLGVHVNRWVMKLPQCGGPQGLGVLGAKKCFPCVSYHHAGQSGISRNGDKNTYCPWGEGVVGI